MRLMPVFQKCFLQGTAGKQLITFLKYSVTTQVTKDFSGAKEMPEKSL